MANNALRILIADKHPGQVRGIERILNILGYYSIACADSYSELRALTAPHIQPFDLLIVDSLLTTYEGVDLAHFCQFNPHVFHSLIYRDDRIDLPQMSPIGHQALCASLQRIPDYQSIADLMLLVDRSSLVLSTAAHPVRLAQVPAGRQLTFTTPVHAMDYTALPQSSR